MMNVGNVGGIGLCWGDVFERDAYIRMDVRLFIQEELQLLMIARDNVYVYHCRDDRVNMEC